MSKIPSGGAGKGDTYRKVNKKKYDENYDLIFGKKEIKEEKNKPKKDK